MQRLKDQVAIITGAASGIGRATALRFTAEGAKLFCMDMQEQALADTAKMISDAGGEAKTCICDVSDEAQVSAAIKACVDAFGKIDHVINMAGILRFGETHEFEAGHFDQIMKVNVAGTFLMCKAALPYLIESNGSIVNAASTAAHSGLPWGACYSASKGAILSMTRSIAVEYSEMGVRANTVSPGDIVTEGMANPELPKGVNMKLMQRAMSLTGRKGPEVIASAIALLCSEDGVHITGEDIRIDGGTLS